MSGEPFIEVEDQTAPRQSGGTTIVLFQPCQLQDADFIAHARTDLPAALDQLDADGGLMRRALEAVGVGRSYHAEAWDDAKRLCADHGWHRTDAEEMDAVMVALRARLGEAPAQEEPKP